MMRINLLIGLWVCALVYGLSGCNPKRSADAQSVGTDTTAYEPVTPAEEAEMDSLEDEFEEDNAANRLSWRDIPDGEKPVRLDFEKWLTIMNHIRDNYWSRPKAKMLANAGLKVLQESDDIDETGIKAVDFRYGRQIKTVTDSAGVEYYTYGGNHAIMFMVDAYTSSGAEILFRSPADLKDFIQQAINRGVAEMPGDGILVCDKPMGKGIHKISKTYEHTETKKGAYKERYILYPTYDPQEEWQRCEVTLDFLRHRIDIEK
jgi:hypothetical protein